MQVRRLLWVALGVAAIALPGCKEGGPRTTSYLVKPGEQKLRAAVLPFESATLQNDSAGQIVSQEIVTALLATGMFDVVDPGAVYQAMVDAGLRNGNGYGMGPDALAKLQDKTGPVNIFVVGIVQEFGEVRIGPASYPSISINARVLDAATGRILWSGSASRTGADSEKFFGLGAVHSPGRLARAAVRDLLGSIDRAGLAKILQTADTPPAATSTHTVPSRAAAPTGKEKYFDESAAYSEAQLTGLMVDVPGLTKGPVEYREHHFSIVETTYQGQGFEMTAKLVDYRKAEAALGYVKHDHPGEPEATFAGLPSYARASAAQTPGAYRLGVAAGRFGLFVSGPADRQGEIEKLARAMIDAMK